MHENIWLRFQAPPHLFSQIMENIAYNVTEHLGRSLRMRLTCSYLRSFCNVQSLLHQVCTCWFPIYVLLHVTNCLNLSLSASNYHKEAQC